MRVRRLSLRSPGNRAARRSLRGFPPCVPRSAAAGILGPPGDRPSATSAPGRLTGRPSALGASGGRAVRCPERASVSPRRASAAATTRGRLWISRECRAARRLPLRASRFGAFHPASLLAARSDERTERSTALQQSARLISRVGHGIICRNKVACERRGYRRARRT